MLSCLTTTDLALIEHAAATVSERLCKGYELGKSGWDDEEDCSQEYLDQLLLDAAAEMDYKSVLAYAAMLSYRNGPEGS